MPLRQPACAALLSLVATCGMASAVQAQEGKEKAKPEKAPPEAAAPADAQAEKLPIRKVVLFNSGVGFFEHRGKVDDDDQIDLQFKVDDINDLLKSMVLQDLDGGKISTVSFASREPITRTLKTFSIDLTGNPTLGDLLDQARGRKIEIDAPNKISGIIIGVETRQERVGNEGAVISKQHLNLLTDNGLRSVALESVGQIKFVDPELNAELREALKILALARTNDKKSVTLNFLGEGERDVRIGYILEAPVWKTSYRMVLKDEEQPFLQGWAIVENTTDSDWKDVGLTLVSGRPISFVMDLYSPLYATRPVVQQELYASLRPQLYEQDMESKDAEFRRMADGKGQEDKYRAREQLARAAAAAPGAPAGKNFAARDAAPAQEAMEKADMDLRQGVATAAQAGEVGEMFQYAIGTPVTLPRQRSAMLPIVNESVKGEKLSIYNQNVHAKHPLNGLKVVNSSGLHLMQGPVTVFDDGVYAGDAKFPDLPPGSERLVSYAMDLDTEVAPTTNNHPQQLTSTKLSKGTLYVSHKYTRTQSYTIKNAGKATKKVLIEYPIDNSWTLVKPKEPAEKARDVYRFLVDANPGEPAKLDIEEERVVNQGILVTNIDDGTIAYYLSQKVVSEDVKNALREVIKRKTAIGEVVGKRQRLEQQVAVIGQEQERIRKNMAELPKNSDLFNRYIKKFTEQEDEIETLRKQIAEQIAEEAKLRKALDDYLLGLELS